MIKPGDAEANCISAIYGFLKPLSPRSRQRVIDYVISVLDEEGTRLEKIPQAEWPKR